MKGHVCHREFLNEFNNLVLQFKAKFKFWMSEPNASS